MKFHESATGYGMTGLSNDEITVAIATCVEAAKLKFGSVPLIINSRTWDMDYGDVLPDGFVFVGPDMNAWKATERIAKAKQ